MPRTHNPIPVVDLFAGPGGLGEGFSSVIDTEGNHVFKIVLSVEMDEHAHRTLTLRAFYRQFDDESRPQQYYDYLLNPSEAKRDALFAAHPRQAQAALREAWRHELREETADTVTRAARAALKSRKTWVLIGGPPCQAYSLVGRARRKNDATFSSDHKHTLYRRYLDLIDDLEPPVFVMENVKGMLSARLGEKSTIEMVLEDLRQAGSGYDIYSFVKPTDDASSLSPSDFVIRSEDYGIPQCRHRVILLGIRRKGIGRRAWGAIDVLRPAAEPIAAARVLDDLPRLRSRLSHRRGTKPDSVESWQAVLAEALDQMDGTDEDVIQCARATVAAARSQTPPAAVTPSWPPAQRAERLVHPRWYLRDHRAPTNLNHNARAHMPSDIARYLFCAAFARAKGHSPKLEDFPTAMLPNHRSAAAGVTASHFGDRFRVQLDGRPATTVTSHISKDGHYYIHYDPSQCRSLSVREAARLQTFPDDYFFEGNRTQQYHQVGNAVPPLLAVQLGAIVARVLGVDTGQTPSW